MGTQVLPGGSRRSAGVGRQMCSGRRRGKQFRDLGRAAKLWDGRRPAVLRNQVDRLGNPPLRAPGLPALSSPPDQPGHPLFSLPAVHSQAAGGAALPAPEAAVHGGSRPYALYPGVEEPRPGELGFQPGGLSDPWNLFRNQGLADPGQRGRSLAGKNPGARAGPPGLAHLGPGRSQCCRSGSDLLRRALPDGLDPAHHRRPEGQDRPGTEWAPRVCSAVGSRNSGGRGLCLPGEPPSRTGT